MRVAAQVIQELARPGERGLRVNHPGFVAAASQRGTASRGSPWGQDTTRDGRPRRPCGNACPLLGLVEDPLCATGRQMPPLLLAHEQPGLRPIPAPVGAEFVQEPRGEQGIAVLASLAFIDADQHPLRVNVAKLQPHQFRDPQAAPVGRHQQDAVLDVGAGGEPSASCSPEAARRRRRRPGGSATPGVSGPHPCTCRFRRSPRAALGAPRRSTLPRSAGQPAKGDHRPLRQGLRTGRQGTAPTGMPAPRAVEVVQRRQLLGQHRQGLGMQGISAEELLLHL